MNKNTVIRIVDDEPDVRQALQLMLEIEGWQTRVYESGFRFLTEDNMHDPGVVLLDVRMPQMSGPELQRRMCERNIRLPVIFVTGHADIDVAIATLKKGAVDFLLKPVDCEHLIDAIENAVRLDNERRMGLAAESVVREGMDKLTGREKQTLKLFMKKLDDRQVAEYLGISERTVQGHRAKIYAKFGIHSAKELDVLMPEIEGCLQTPPA